MIDINKLNRVKGVLSARLGAEIPKYQTGAKFVKKKDNTVIYSSDGNTWFSDPNLTIKFEGDISQFEDPDLQSVKTTKIPGGNPNEGKPNAAVEKNAELLERAADVATQTLATELSKDGYMLSPLTVVASKNNPTELNLPKTVDTSPERLASIAKMQETAGMNLERLRLEQESAKNARAGQMAQFATNAFTAIGDVFGAALQATDSDLTKGITAGYNAILSVASNFGPAGRAVSGVMGIASSAGNILQALGGGTDQMTTTDKWMDSPLFSWNVGAINGFFGKKANSFGLDYDSVEEVGSSYGGTVADLEDAKSKAGKKYGLFSRSSRKKANAAIAEVKAKQNLLGEVVDTAEDQRLAASSMGLQAGLAYSMMTSGGYDLKYTYAAKHGGLLEWNPVLTLEWEPQIELNWELPTFKEGGNININEELEWIPELQKEDKKSFEEWFNSIPEKYRASGYDYKKAYEVFSWDELRKHALDPHNNHLRSVSSIADEDGKIPFLKLGILKDNKELEGEFNFYYNTPAGKEWSTKYDLLYIGDRYYYVPKKYKEGGSIKDLDVPEIEETNLKNVIPEGALHKNKHHMEHADGLTKKGIPVIDEEGELQAEIEHSEIIFTLEVTKKLEEYYSIFYSDETSNKEKELAALDAGKLLVYQILENTEDRTGLIESCKKGGSLTLKKSTDDLIEEVLEWIPTLMIIEEVQEETKKGNEKTKPKSEKSQMKEAVKEVLIELLTK